MSPRQELEARRDRLSMEIERLKNKYGHDEMIDLLEERFQNINSEIAETLEPSTKPRGR